MASLQCSACRAPMQIFFYGTVEIDVCTACEASWFDQRELDKISGRLPMFAASGYSDRDCPICVFRMQKGTLQSLVEAERCEHCKGFFLDKGELATLAGFDIRPTRKLPAPAATLPTTPVRLSSPSMLTPPPPQPAPTPQRQEPIEEEVPPAPIRREASEVPVQDANFWGASEVPREVGFGCVVCNQRFPMTEGNYFRGGLACSGCTPQVQMSARERAEANGGWLQNDWRQQAGPLTLTDFLFGLFGRRRIGPF